jgi:hypothetical protein
MAIINQTHESLHSLFSKRNPIPEWRRTLGLGLMAGFGGETGQRLAGSSLFDRGQAPAIPVWNPDAATPPYMPVNTPSAPALQWGGWRRLGGYVEPHKVYITGENGPEAIVPLEPAVVVPNPNTQTAVAAAGSGDAPPPVYRPLTTTPPAAPAPVYQQSVQSELNPAVSEMPDDSQNAADNQRPPSLPYVALSPAQQVRQREIDYLNAQTAQAPRQPKFWNRLGSGILDGLRAWAQAGAPGGVGGAIGAIATGGALFAASPKAQAEYQKFQNVQEKANLYQQAVANEALNAQRQMQALKQKEALTSLVFKDPVFNKGYLTEGDVSYLEKQYGVQVRDPNNPKLVYDRINGKTYFVYANDPSKAAVVPGLPTDLTQQPVTVHTSAGDFTLTPPDAAHLYAQDANRRSRESTEQQKFQLEQQKLAAQNKWKEWEREFHEKKLALDSWAKQANVLLQQAAASNKINSGSQEIFNLYQTQGENARNQAQLKMDLINQKLADGYPADDPEVVKLQNEAYKLSQEAVKYFQQAVKSLPPAVAKQIPETPFPPKPEDTITSSGTQPENRRQPAYRTQLNRIPPRKVAP